MRTLSYPPCPWVGESGVGTKVRLEVELNSRGEVLLLTDSKLLMRGMQGVTGRTSLNWLFGGVDAFVLRLGVLRQCFQGGDWLLDVNLPGPKLVSQGASVFRNWRNIFGAAVWVDLLTVGRVWLKLYSHLDAQSFTHCGKLFQGSLGKK